MSNHLIDYVESKGYTVSECSPPAPKRVPDWYLKLFPDATYERYSEHLHDYLNGH